MKIVIVGGGTTGWWSAGLLEKSFPDWNITLIESPNIPSIDVGEATQPSVAGFFNILGISDKDWMPKCNATIKHGNVKQGWKTKDDEAFNFTFWFDQGKDFDNWVPGYLEGKKNKNSLNSELYDPSKWMGYAYHISANEISKIVKDNCKNVTHIYDTVTERPECDLLIDCTGFKQQFVEDKTYIDIKHHLVNSAVVATWEKNTEVDNVTFSYARDYGWQFYIPLKNRIGSGYIYSDDYVSDDDAMAEYMNNMKEYSIISNPRVIKWDPSKILANPWSGNTVSIGLSNGFVDPLEASGLSHIQFNIKTLVKCLKRGYSRETYNRAVNRALRETTDVILSHYALSQRDDTAFWRYYKNNTELASYIRKNIWKNYSKRSNNLTNMYPSSFWASVGLYFDEFEHYQPL